MREDLESLYMQIYSKLLGELGEEELNSSVTFSLMRYNFDRFVKFFVYLNNILDKRERLIDLGCGYGFVAFLFKELLGFREAFGVDLDDLRIDRAKRFLDTVLKVDLERDSLPFPDEYFDLAISFGVLDHLVFWDNFFSNAYRVLRPGSPLVISLTNLGSWDSRLSLLLGYQPRHVEVSKRSVSGVLKYYIVKSPVGHIHTVTLKTMIELAKLYGFKATKVYGLKAGVYGNSVAKLIDTFMSYFPGLATRYLIVLQKEI